MNPNLGGYKVKRTTHGVPDVVPRRGDKSIPHDQRVFQGQTRAHAEAAGRLRGNAAQGRYFAKTYGQAAKITRRVGAVGAVVGAAGLGHRYYDKHKKVKKNLAMPKGVRIKGANAVTDVRGQVHFLNNLPKVNPGNPQRVLTTVRRPKRKLVRAGARGLPSRTGAVVTKSYLLDMPS